MQIEELVFPKADRLKNVHYEIRGGIVDLAEKMEKEGETLLKLNIGNLSAFDFKPSNFVNEFIKKNLEKCSQYTETEGLESARYQVLRYNKFKNFRNCYSIFLGNGASELISIVLCALLNPGDEVLIPTPDYPLWTASVSVNEGRAIHYLCDESKGWEPNINDIESKINENTKAIVVINPNNPTGAVYSERVLREIVDLARKNSILILADEIYDQIVYDGDCHVSLASLDDDVPVITFNGLSKNFRACGFRAGWMSISGDESLTADLVSGIETLCSMRLCSNVFGQLAIEASIIEFFENRTPLAEMISRLRERRDAAISEIDKVEGLSTVSPKGSMYMFPRIDLDVYKIGDDKRFVMDFLRDCGVMVVHGRGFNWVSSDHFRIVTLPEPRVLKTAINKLGGFLLKYRR